MEPLRTTSEVIDALGGTAQVARLAHRSMQAVSNWRERGAFPPGTFILLSGALSTAGLAADASLWKMAGAQFAPAFPATPAPEVVA